MNFGIMLLKELRGLNELSLNEIDQTEYIGTTETSKILGLSESTVRRLADDKKLKCYTLTTNNYRKFKKTDVIRFKDEIYKTSGKNQEFTISQLNLFQPDLDKRSNMKNIRAKSHPAHYLMHKYWGRKPHNVVSDYINNYTDIGDVVLDPFMGSGVVPIEAAKNRRTGIGVDINPMSKFIAQNTVSNIDLINYKKIANRILENVEKEYKYLYETTCPHCEKEGNIEIAVWDHGKLARIKGKCTTDGVFVKDADNTDLEKYEQLISFKKNLDSSRDISYPKDKVLKYVKRSGKESIDQLFSDRALIILSKLIKEINQIEELEMRNLLNFTFTSMLANVSNMLPGDLDRATYKSGWVISKFWTPKIHTERNIFHCFRLRMKAVIKGKTELSEVDDTFIKLFNKDSNNLDFIDSESIDYIFTDPPYGESIAYLALSQFWNSWLDNKVNYDKEIIIDHNRNKDYKDYGERMLKSFTEMYRVLKNKRFLSFTFHNRDLNVWKAVLDAVKKSGFILKDITLQEQAVKSGTQGINKMNTLTGDFVYTLYKDDNIVLHSNRQNLPADSRVFIEENIENIINNNKGITPSKLYEELIPIIVRNEAYTDDKGNAIDIEKILKNKYHYYKDETEKILGDNYKWKLNK